MLTTKVAGIKISAGRFIARIIILVHRQVALVPLQGNRGISPGVRRRERHDDFAGWIAPWAMEVRT